VTCNDTAACERSATKIVSRCLETGFSGPKVPLTCVRALTLTGAGTLALAMIFIRRCGAGPRM
jgi:hypothetical protein